jgi:hypothetical protein
LLPGARAKLSAASIVLPGAVLPTVAAVKSPEQALPPLELVQDASALASVFNLFVGAVSVVGTAAPGEAPVLTFTRLFAVRKALFRPAVLLQLAPTLPPLVMKEASDHTEAAVVTSFTTKLLPAATLPHGPSPVISQRAELAGPEPPAPPLESR